MTALPFDVTRRQLDNGLRVFVVRQPGSGLASFWSIVRTGSRDEVESGRTGFAHFFEHMMFRGTARFPGPDYERTVSSLGADTVAFTSDDLTAYQLTVAARDLPTVVDLEADRFRNLAYDETTFRTEAGAIAGEYRKNRANPFFTLYEGLGAAAFDVHPYGHTPMGTIADIARMPELYGWSLEFFDRFYRPDNVVVLVAGDVDPDDTVGLVAEHYKGWAPGYRPSDVPMEPAQTGPRRTTVPFAGDTPLMLAIAMRGAAWDPDDPQVVAAELVVELAVGATSPAYRDLLVDGARVDMLAGSVAPNRDPGLWSVLARLTDPVHLPLVERRIWTELEDLATAAVDADRLDAIRAHTRYRVLAGLRHPQQIGGALSRMVAITGEVDGVDRWLSTLDRVTARDVRAAAARWFQPQSSTTAVMHPQDVEQAHAAVITPDRDPTSIRSATSDVSTVLRDRAVTMPGDDPIVTMSMHIRVGSQDDPIGREGLAALTGATVAAGSTRDRSWPQLLAALYPMAARLDVAVDREVTTVTAVAHRDHVSALADLLVEVVTRPAWTPDDVERHRKHAVVGVAQTLRWSSEEELAKAVLQSEQFAGTGYAHPVAGTVDSLEGLTAADVAAFHRQYWTRDAVTLGFAGDYPRDLPERVASGLAVLPAGPRPPVPGPPAVTVPDGHHLTIVDKPGPSAAISIGRPIDVLRTDVDFPALALAVSWLGEHRNGVGRLFQLIRGARGLNYGDYAYLEAFPDGGVRQHPPTGVPRRAQLFELWLRPVDRVDAAFAIHAALREVQRLVADGLTPQEVAEHRRFLTGYLAHRAPTSTAQLGDALDERFFAGLGSGRPRQPGGVLGLVDALERLTVTQVNAAIARHLDLSSATIVVVADDADDLARILQSDTVSPPAYAGRTVDPAVLAEDVEIARYRFRVTQAQVVAVDEVFAHGSRRV